MLNFGLTFDVKNNEGINWIFVASNNNLMQERP